MQDYLDKKSILPKLPRVNFYLTENERVELKIMCVLTKRTMTQFIRISIQDKIKALKAGNLNDSRNDRQQRMANEPPIPNR